MDRKQKEFEQELFEPKTNEFDGSVNAVSDTGGFTNEFADDLDGEYEEEFSPFREAEVDTTEAMNPSNGSMTGTEQADEEYAAEVAPAPRALVQPEKERPMESRAADRESEQTAGAGMGWTALILALASLFLLPQWLGPAAAIVGAIAWTRGSRALGVWSIVIGLISLVSYFILVPLYA